MKLIHREDASKENNLSLCAETPILRPFERTTLQQDGCLWLFMHGSAMLSLINRAPLRPSSFISELDASDYSASCLAVARLLISWHSDDCT